MVTPTRPPDGRQVSAPDTLPVAPRLHAPARIPLPVTRLTVALGAVLVAAATGAGVAFGPMAAAVPMGLLAGFLLVRGFESILHIAIASVFVESIALGGNARIGRLVAVVAIGSIVARVLMTDWRPNRLSARMWVPAAIFGLWALAGGYWAQDTGAWVERMLEFALAGAYFLLFATFLEGPEQLRRVLRTFALGAVAASFLAIGQGVTGARAVGLQGDPNLFSLYQVMAVPVCASLARTTSVSASRLWELALLPIAASVLASQSRGGAITLAVVVAAVMFRRDGAFFVGSRRAVAFVTLAAGVLVLLVFAGDQITRRFDPERVAVDRASARIDIWRVAWRAALRDPFLGLGGGNFQSQSIELLQSEPGVELVGSHHLLLGRGPEVHNIYLETFVDYGIPGVLAYLLVLGVTAMTIRRVHRDGPRTVVPALGGMLLAFATATVFLSILNAKLLWSTAGVAAALGSRRLQGRARGPAPDGISPGGLEAKTN